MTRSPTPPYFSYNVEHHGTELAETLDTKLTVPRRNIIRGADASWITCDALGLTWRWMETDPDAP